MDAAGLGVDELLALTFSSDQSAPGAPAAPAAPTEQGAPKENPFACERHDRYLEVRSSSNATLDDYVHVWAQRQTKGNMPHVNDLSGRGKLTRFEKAKALGYRAHMLEKGEPELVPTSTHDTVLTVAEREFAQGLLGFMRIHRVKPDGAIETVPMGELVYLE